jgi:hypothetical protein
MSFESFIRYDFLTLKELGNSFTVFVKGYREMETKFGLGHYLIVEVGKKTKPKQKLKEGLLKISPTTGGTIAKLVPDLKHLEDLKDHFLTFEYNPDLRTIEAVDISEGIQ